MQLLSEHKYFFLAVCWTILITTLSLVTIEKTPIFALKVPFKDKIVHFVFYFVFVLLWSLSLKHKKKNMFFILLVAIVYGIIIEGLQYAVTKNRTADFYDVLANSSGAIIAYIAFPIVMRFFSKAEIKN